MDRRGEGQREVKFHDSLRMEMNLYIRVTLGEKEDLGSAEDTSCNNCAAGVCIRMVFSD